MTTKEFSLGSIEYRLPNVVESMRLLGKIGVKADGTTGARSELEVMADLLDEIKPFVTKIAATKAGKVISDWDAALQHMEFIAPLSEIANEIMAQFNTGTTGKARKKS